MSRCPSMWISALAVVGMLSAPCRGGAVGETRAASATSASAPDVEVLCEFDVLPGNVLYVYGEQVHHARLTHARGDSLRLNGVAIYPRHPPSMAATPKATIESFAKYEHRYGQVPYVEERVAEGDSVGEAIYDFIVETQFRIPRLLREAFAASLERGDSTDEAARGAFAGLREIDRYELVDWERGPAVAGSGIRLVWRGVSRSLSVELRPLAGSVSDSMPSDEDLRARASMLHETLALHQPCWCIIGAGGYGQHCGQDIVSRLSAEVSRVLATGQTSDVQALGEANAREILARYKESTGLPN